MRGWAGVVRLLAMCIWVGGLVFFAFVLAPVAFRTLPSVKLAGSVVGATLRVFDLLAMGCGVAFLAGTAAVLARGLGRRWLEAQMGLAALMLLATAYLHWGILPAMDADRTRAGGDVSAAAISDPARMDFDRLHVRSERLEGTVLLVGLGVVGLMGWSGVRTR